MKTLRNFMTLVYPSDSFTLQNNFYKWHQLRSEHELFELQNEQSAYDSHRPCFYWI